MKITHATKVNKAVGVCTLLTESCIDLYVGWQANVCNVRRQSNFVIQMFRFTMVINSYQRPSSELERMNNCQPKISFKPAGYKYYCTLKYPLTVLLP
jgi:hypothetical protein